MIDREAVRSLPLPRSSASHILRIVDVRLNQVRSESSRTRPGTVSLFVFCFIDRWLAGTDILESAGEDTTTTIEIDEVCKIPTCHHIIPITRNDVSED
jgi:hypothetical protein